MPGETVAFSVPPHLQLVGGLKFDWTVSLGTIETGQGSSDIVVRTTSSDSFKTMKAKVVVSGLPKECNSVAEGSATILGIAHYPVPLDVFGRLSVNDQKGRLDNVAAELKQNPSQVALFILHHKEGTAEKDLSARVRFIKNHIVGFRKLPANRIVIKSEPTTDNYTTIYKIPPGVVDSYCSGCRTH
jgi:hypothetical protein